MPYVLALSTLKDTDDQQVVEPALPVASDDVLSSDTPVLNPTPSVAEPGMSVRPLVPPPIASAERNTEVPGNQQQSDVSDVPNVLSSASEISTEVSVVQSSASAVAASAGVTNDDVPVLATPTKVEPISGNSTVQSEASDTPEIPEASADTAAASPPPLKDEPVPVADDADVGAQIVNTTARTNGTQLGDDNSQVPQEDAANVSSQAPPAPPKESVFIRLNNRIKALDNRLDANVTLIQHYLGELSARYDPKIVFCMCVCVCVSVCLCLNMHGGQKKKKQKKRKKGIVACQKQLQGAVWCKTRLLNSGGQFDQLCNFIDGAILARALC